MIKYFKPYHISHDEPTLPDPKPPLSIDKLLKSFSPDDNFIHRRILYEITGRKIHENDQYSDDDPSHFAHQGDHQGDEYYTEGRSQSDNLSSLNLNAPKRSKGLSFASS